MGDEFDADLVVVGFGSAGMTAAELGAQLGLKVAVVDRGRAGGDCLWTGCVPSKALIAAASVARHLRTAGSFGLPASSATIDTAAVWRQVRAVREQIAEGDDDPQRFLAMGVAFHWGEAQIVGPNQVAVTSDRGAVTLTGRVILVCTGGHPTVPAIPGLAAEPFLTNETLFELEQVPRRVVFIGGGPISIELAQAFVQLGIGATVLQSGARVLARDEPELVDQLVEIVTGEGVEVCCGVEVRRVEPGPVIVGIVDGVERRWETDAIVVAAGREVDVETLGLGAVGVEVDERGVVVDAQGRTAVSSIYAAGDVTGRQLFTHAAAHQAAVAVPRRVLSRARETCTGRAVGDVHRAGAGPRRAHRRRGPRSLRRPPSFASTDGRWSTTTGPSSSRSRGRSCSSSEPGGSVPG